MPPPPISPLLLRWFRRVVRRYLGRHFHAVRLAEGAPGSIPGPVIVYANHSSWWDPMVAFLLGEELFPNRSSYAPMDAVALGRYGILRKLGVFPVHTGSPRGAAELLRVGEQVLAADGVLWITPQGRFADTRERPLVFKPGLAALATRAARRLGSCTVLPLAIEYPFWDERLPECLLRLGTPIRVTPGFSAEDLEARLRAALTSEMDALANQAAGRSPAPFRTLIVGGAGTGGFYSVLRRLRALIMRRRYMAEHTPHDVPEQAEGRLAAVSGPSPREAR